MVGETDKTDHPFLPGFEQACIQTLGILRIRQLPGVMQLQNIHIIGPQISQAGFKLLEQGLLVFSLRLGGQNNLASHISKRIANLFFTIRIGASGVKKVDAAVIRFAQDGFSLIKSDSLNR